MCRSDMEKVEGDHGLVRMQSNVQDMISTRNAKPDEDHPHTTLSNKKPNIADVNVDTTDNLNGVGVDDDTSELPIELQQGFNVSEGASSLVQANSNSSGESFTSSSPHDQHLAALGVVDQAPNYSESTSVSTGLHPVIDNHIHSSTTFHSLLLSDDNSCTPFFLPKSAWPQSSDGVAPAPATSESTSHFLSSSLLNSATDHLSLASNKSTPALVPLAYHSNQLPAGAMNATVMQFGDVGYHVIASHFGNAGPESDQYSSATMHPSSYSCFTTPYMHTDKMASDQFGAADVNGDCGMYNTNQYLQDNEQMSYVYPSYAYNAAYPGTAAGSHGMNGYPANYALPQMDFHGSEHAFINAAGHGAGSPYLAHSGSSVAVYFDHMGIQQGVVNIADHHHQSYATNMPINNSSPEGLGSSLTLAMEDQATTNINHCPVDTTTTAAHWKAQQQRNGKGSIPKPNNKRASPDGEDDDHMQECSPPLKRSTSWNCMSSISTASSSSPPLDHTMRAVYNNNNTNQAVVAPKPSPKQSIEKPRARQGIANDPQSVAARHRRERISERLKTLQQLVPNGSKVDLVTMLEKAINYVKFLQLQVKVLATDEYWPTPLNKFPKVANLGKLAEKDTLTKTEKSNDVECKKVDEQAAA